VSDLIFKRNLLALSAADPELGERLIEAAPDPRLRVEVARNGLPVPVVKTGSREAALHSLMDPVREAERLVQALPPGGFLVALGLGAGYGIKPYLVSSATTGVLIVEYSAPLLRALLEEIDLSEIFLDGRVSLLLDPSPEELQLALFSSYVPPLAGDIRSIPLRSRTDLDPEPFSLAASTIRAVLGRISDDYSVQAFFGKLWFRNAVRNLFASERPAPSLPPVRRAVVTAAGPSLEEGMGAIAAAKKAGDFLIATDTSLPALLGSGLMPSAVISIDCQTISYYHFLKGLPAGIPLILDLASPNRLARLSDSVRFFSSGHPFCAFVSARYRPFPALDTSGGNVTHAALSLAAALGAESCLVVGADFSYPEGKSYARGTYIYDYFDLLSGRLAPTESQFTGFVWRNASVFKESDRDGEGRSYVRYVTKPLMSYREHFERFAAGCKMEIRPLKGKGVLIKTPPARPRPAGGEAIGGGAARFAPRSLFSAGPARESAASFLKGYAASLAALPEPREPAAVYLRSLAPEDRDLWTTLLPTASAFQRAAGQDGKGPAPLLSEVRDWALAEVAEALSEAKAEK
jgi:hypothetical protein